MEVCHVTRRLCFVLILILQLYSLPAGVREYWKFSSGVCAISLLYHTLRYPNARSDSCSYRFFFFYFLHPVILQTQSHALLYLRITLYSKESSSWIWILCRTLQLTSVSRVLCFSSETIPFFPDDVTSTFGLLVGAWASTGIVFQQASGCPVGGRGWTEEEEM